MIEIKEISGEKALKEFIKFPERLYGHKNEMYNIEI